MAAAQLPVVEIKDDFYHDGFAKVILIISGILLAIFSLVALGIYLYLNKPPPITFGVYQDWRVQDDVPIRQPYLSDPDLLQWVSNTLQAVFVFDFLHYNAQLKTYNQYFTNNGWQVFLNQLNNYVNYNKVQSYKQFVNGAAAGAPFITNQGLLSGRYGWWVQMPIAINFVNYNGPSSQTLTLQVLVVRVSTLNNLNGVAIDNVIVAKNTTNQS